MWRKSIVLSRKYSVFTQSLQVEDIKKKKNKKKSCNYPDNSTIRGPECDTRGKQECTQPAAHIVLVDTKGSLFDIRGGFLILAHFVALIFPIIGPSKCTQKQFIWGWISHMGPPPASFTTHMDRHIWGLEPVNRFLLSLASPCWMPTWPRLRF